MLLLLHTDVGNCSRNPRLNPNPQFLPTVQNLLTHSLTRATSTHTGESAGLQVTQSRVPQILTVNDLLKPSAEVHRFRLTLSAFARRDLGQNKESEKSHWYNFAEQSCQDWSCYHICRRTRSEPSAARNPTRAITSSCLRIQPGLAPRLPKYQSQRYIKTKVGFF